MSKMEIAIIALDKGKTAINLSVSGQSIVIHEPFARHLAPMLKKQKSPLTPRHRQAYDFISWYMSENRGVAPSVREIMRGIGIYSSGGMYNILKALQTKGWIRLLPSTHRGIVLITD